MDPVGGPHGDEADPLSAHCGTVGAGEAWAASSAGRSDADLNDRTQPSSVHLSAGCRMGGRALRSGGAVAVFVCGLRHNTTASTDNQRKYAVKAVRS